MRELRARLLIGALAGTALMLPPPAVGGRAGRGPDAAPDTTARARAIHLLNRITFGPRPGDVDHVVAIGVDRFIAQQLKPERIQDDDMQHRLSAFEVLRLSPAELARTIQQEQRERQARRRTPADGSPIPAAADRQGPTRARRLAAELQQAAVVRATLSERQLYEVMVDFWTNHFNVFLGKGADRFLLPDYIEHTIRPHAMGKFEDLLIATAQSPAMLFYLDNAQSVAPGSKPPQLARLEQRGARTGRGRQMVPRGSPAGGVGRPGQRMPADSLRGRVAARVPRGINENYARELLELHTLGVDGGYTQEDVVNLARVLTGWSLAPPQRGGGFQFNDWAHDQGEKVVLGQRFAGERGMDEGVAALRLLAHHPATSRHVVGKLCTRFVADDPPEGCIDAGVQAWERTDGDVREVVGAILATPEFWAPENRGSKIKTPLEFVVSAVRAVGGSPDSTLALAQIVARLGQPLFLQQPPTGYPETQESWVNSGALLERLNVAMGIAAGRAPGVTVDLDRLFPATPTGMIDVDLINDRVLGGRASANTLRVIREQVANLAPQQARVMAVGLALGSPEFQRQ